LAPTPASDPRVVALLESSPRWWHVDAVAVTGSTNADVVALAQVGTASGYVLVAERQTAGRGRLDRTWHDHPGGSLLLSCLVDAPATATHAPLAAGLALVDAISGTGAQPTLKWLNDVELDARKCAGVLIEVTGDGRLVVGVGVDLDWRGVARDGERQRWTSVAEHVGADIDGAGLLVRLLGALDRHLRTADDDPAALVDRYREACSSLGRDVTVELGTRTVRGRASAIDARGALVVETAEGPVTVEVGDVVHLQ
jgi:BirA family transcriptional regulator, biotin operon repressor / biotin---[acetyl-CoA-carboxylase] ligase